MGVSDVDLFDDEPLETLSEQIYFQLDQGEEIKEGELRLITDWNALAHDLICLHTKEGYNAKDDIHRLLEFNYIGLDHNNWSNDKEIKIFHEDNDSR